MFEPGNVDPERFCMQASVWRADSDLSGFPRLAAEYPGGRLACRVTGSVDRDGSRRLHLEIRGELIVTCQRCLSEMPFALVIDRDLCLARSTAELERYEADANFGGDAIPIAEHMSFTELIEDEVLLGLPFAPMHEPGECTLPESLSKGV